MYTTNLQEIILALIEKQKYMYIRDLFIFLNINELLIKKAVLGLINLKIVQIIDLNQKPDKINFIKFFYNTTTGEKKYYGYYYELP